MASPLGSQAASSLIHTSTTAGKTCGPSRLSQYLYLALDYQAPVRDIEGGAKQVNVTLATLDRAAKLDVEVERFQRNRGWWWRLPKALVDMLDQQQRDDESDDEDRDREPLRLQTSEP